MSIHKTLTRRGVTMSLALVLASTAALPTFAGEVLKFGHVYETGTPFHEAALRAADAFEEATGGEHKIEVFPASQLGKESALNEALALGTVDIIYTGPAFMSQSYPPIAISDFPFTLRGVDHWKAYAESDLFGELSEGYTQVTGNVVAAMTYYGSRHVTANKPILAPSDMEGLKIRTPNAPAYQLFPAETGANPTPMAFAEVYLALQQGVVDAQENPLPTIQFKKFHEVQSDINLTGHIINSLVTIVSPMTKAKLGDDYAKLETSLQGSAGWATDAIVASEEELVGWFKDQGTNVNEVDRAPFIEAVAPALTSADMPWDASIYERLQAIED
ncbi:tripartite ATP-independent transporter DctP family solute receptor [Pacificibacter maritimus]|uniref:Tripartite ATP-independent transporter DctP family solute receptor n=1 Tax=Pacificibacter maritimus TaxID=762213 RepID=A0A3N4TWV4_9RHOB|nr:sialic acid TRAP transporter substrate-binding protein SiaP [Pacificibacter maritimus]RPE62952.1 tripartite ATP-independent transporter DctP family solute receptor [Pacificibacter maritimus]